MSQPFPQAEPLEERYRRPGRLKRGYDALVDADNMLAHADDPGARWKRVVRKQRDSNNDVLLTFDDDTQLTVADRGAIYSRRLAPE